MKQKSKCERPTETKGNKPWTKFSLSAQEKHPVSLNIPKSLKVKRFCIQYCTFEHPGIHHIVVFKVSIYA